MPNWAVAFPKIMRSKNAVNEIRLISMMILYKISNVNYNRLLSFSGRLIISR